MPDNPDEVFPEQKTESWFRVTDWLLRCKVTTGVRSRHFVIITVLFAVFTYVYYGILDSYHDIYVIIFFYPLIYAAVVYRTRGVVISGLVFLAIMLPHALVLAEDLILLARTLIFALFAFLVSGLGATLLNYLEQQMEAYREILALNDELNGYIKRLESAQQQLVQAAKLSALGQLSAAVAHELNNPLAGVLIYTKLLSSRLSGDSFDREKTLANLAKIEEAINYSSGIISSLLDFARQTKPALKPVRISEVIDRVISLAGHQARMNNIEIIVKKDSGLPSVSADSNQLQQVFLNLTVNAIQAMGHGGTLTIRTSLDENGWVAVSVEDTGCGITDENMENLFTPFFTTKEEVKGVGLGLSVSYGIIESHGGIIEVDSEPGKGSVFTVHLPPSRE